MAIIAVVVNHAGPPMVSPFHTVWDTVLRVSWTAYHVPLFLVLSGYLLNRGKPVGLEEIGRRLLRILVPYLLASAIWITILPPKGSVLKILLSGGAHPIYYYIFAISLCIVAMWGISRLPTPVLVAILAGLVVYVIAFRAYPQIRLVRGWYWEVRDPVKNFYFGYFLAGWLIRGHWDVVCEFHRRHRPWVWGISAIGAWMLVMRILDLSMPGMPADFRLPIPAEAIRILFTLFATLVMLACFAGRRAPRWIRFISSATLTIFLVHTLILHELTPRALSMPPLVRIPLEVVVGVAGSVLIAWGGRALLGPTWSRRLIGT